MSEPNKMCRNCPSFLSATQVASVFRRSIGAPMCATYGYVLGKPDASVQQNKAIERERATRCDHYGQPKPHTPLALNTEVFLGIPERRKSDTSSQYVTSCAMCTNFITEGTVTDTIGLTAGVCAAKGRVLIGTRLSSEAADCEYRAYGPVLQGSEGKAVLEGMNYLPLFSDALASIPLTPIKAYFKAKEEGTAIIEPSEYESDKPISAEDIEEGIRAWRRIDDPDGSGNFAYLPIFDPDAKDSEGRPMFSDDEKAMIPQTGDDEHPELYLDHFGGLYGLAVAWEELDETPAMWGQAGVGKTELLRHAAWVMQLPFRRITFTASSDIDDVIGKMHFKEGEGTWFQYGDLPLGWISKCILCLDEPNTAPPEIWQRVRPLTDNSKQMVIAENKNERLDRNMRCYMGLCMNPAWDIRNIGALEVADADSNRLFHTFVDLPPKELEEEIIKERVKLDGWELSDKQIQALMKTAKEIREQAAQDNLSISWAIRQQIKVARALRWFSPVTAYKRAAGDFLEPAQAQILLDQVRSNFPSED